MIEEPLVRGKSGNTEDNVYAGVYRILIGGMLVSTSLFVFGVVRALQHPKFVPLTPQWIRAHYSVSAVLHGLAAMDPTSIMLVATALLILTPVARVLVSIYAFAVDRDTKYVAITSVVLVVMIITVILGLLGLK